jgi:signal transduction histidine kinase
MHHTRGWDVAVVSAAAILGALLVVNGAEGAELLGALATILGVVLTWFLLGRGQSGSTRGMAASGLLIALSGVATAISPGMATMQAIVFPLLWYFSRSTRAAVVANAALAVVVGTGYVVRLGGTPSAVWQAVVIETISLAGSLAIGLWITRISEQSEERAALLDELRRTQARLESVSRDAGVLSERQRLAREIHDTIAQDLTGIVMLAQRTRRELADGGTTLGETVDLLEDSARAALAETRALVAATAPVALAEGGIEAALRRLGERFERETGIAVDVRSSGGSTIERDTEVVLLRCAQEGLANVRKHSGAGAASVVLTVSALSATLVVRDDGVGFDTAAPRHGFGLAGLHDRLELVGGSFAVDASAGRGTVLTAALPLAGVPA